MKTKKQYIKPIIKLVKNDITCNQYWASGWRQNDGTIVTPENPNNNDYWHGGWGHPKNKTIWDIDEDN